MTSPETLIAISPSVVRHLLIAVNKEIGELERIGSSCGDDWPSDYDPNDLAIYRNLRTWLASGAEQGLTILDSIHASTKPIEFLMMLVPNYVRGNAATLEFVESSEIFRTYAHYVALVSLRMLPHALAHPNSSYTNWITRKLESVVKFPYPENP